MDNANLSTHHRISVLGRCTHRRQAHTWVATIACTSGRVICNFSVLQMAFPSKTSCVLLLAAILGLAHVSEAIITAPLNANTNVRCCGTSPGNCVDTGEGFKHNRGALTCAKLQKRWAAWLHLGIYDVVHFACILWTF